jgi:hypothetical protein
LCSVVPTIRSIVGPVQDLNSYQSGIIGGESDYDYPKRTAAFKKVNEELILQAPTEAVLPLITNLLFFLVTRSVEQI